MDVADLAAKVQELWDREAIRQCLLRYCRGADRLDRELILSAFHPDSIDEHGKFVGNRDEFLEWVLNMHSTAQLSHQHCILNHICEIDGDTAHAETYFMFVAMNRKGKPFTIGGGRYVDRLERRQGEWRIAARVTLRDWSQMDEIPDMDDLSSFTSTRALLSDVERAFMNAGRKSTRDRSDPSYERPLEVDPARRDAYRAMVGKSDRSAADTGAT
jgi:SnoaL-like domain